MTGKAKDPSKAQDTSKFYPPTNGLLMHMVRDGIIMGATRSTKGHCENCSRGCEVVRITALNLPSGIRPEDTIAFNKATGKAVVFLGIGCGCYGKFHRQIAHISDRMKARERS